MGDLRIVTLRLILFCGLCGVQYFTHAIDNPLTLQFSPEEIRWVEHNKVSIAVVDSWLPYSFNSSTDKLIGYHLDLLTQIKSNTDTSFKIKKISNWNSAIMAVENGAVQAILGAAYSKQRSKKLFFSSGYLFSQTEIFSQSTNLSINDASDLVSLRFVVIESDILTDYVKNRFPQATIINAGVSNHHFSEFNIIERLGVKYTIAASRQFEIVANILNKGIISVSLAQKQHLFDKWLTAANKHSIFNDRELSYLRPP